LRLLQQELLGLAAGPPIRLIIVWYQSWDFWSDHERCICRFIHDGHLIFNIRNQVIIGYLVDPSEKYGTQQYDRTRCYQDDRNYYYWTILHN